MKRVEVLAGHFAGKDVRSCRTTYEVEHFGVLEKVCLTK